MTGLESAQQTRNRRRINIVAALVLVALAIVGAILFKQNKNDDEALRKAQILHTRLIDAGLAAPDAETIRDSLGSDGGLVCQDPSSPLIKARYQAAISNGASGPGNRPVIADTDMLQATALAIETYCPDHLAAYLKETADLRTGDTVKPGDGQ
ncbi:hypothetical protein [Nocardia huaxiensis]|uniref:DUF732 domain-containing protein n=1 Tax=Nocardia huaxiensis TaxID=2755382 RepID=A0A7D6VC57_9NOCA|nr:hypothetical protein [Nocardia huaxiensis]QLY31571.1 hypothetical protein H0264_04320 [Nocardia huaxiensis]UFS95123.1 hypothetical protein LPY97_31155 [Nocardia huaxiensis]